MTYLISFINWYNKNSIFEIYENESIWIDSLENTNYFLAGEQ